MGILLDIVSDEQLCDLMCGKPEEEIYESEDKKVSECFHCGCKTVVWDADFSFEDFGYEGEGIVQMCHCSNCGAEIEYRIPITEEDIKELKERNEHKTYK